MRATASSPLKMYDLRNKNLLVVRRVTGNDKRGISFYGGPAFQNFEGRRTLMITIKRAMRNMEFWQNTQQVRARTNNDEHGADVYHFRMVAEEIMGVLGIDKPEADLRDVDLTGASDLNRHIRDPEAPEEELA